MFGLTSLRLYAYLAIGVVVLAVFGFIAFQWEQHKADVATIALDKKNAQILTDALRQSEADKALLAQKARELDTAVQVRDQRLKALNDAKRKLADELDRIKATVPEEDKACLARPLPDGILDLLRDGPAGSDAQRHYPDPGSTPKPLPQV
jgi:hypothetical protein